MFFKVVFPFIFLFYSFYNGFSQDKISLNRFILLQGSAEQNVYPDIAQSNILVKVGPMPFGNVIEALENKRANVVKQLIKLGYKDSEIITTNYSVFESFQYENGKRSSEGYIGQQSVYVRLKNTPKKIGEINTAFMTSDEDIRLSFSFRLSDELKKTTKDNLIKEAVLDAKRRAELLSEVSGNRIGKILSIVYNVKNNDAYYPIVEESAMMDISSRDAGVSSHPGFRVEDFKLKETVEIKFEMND
jgi:uncharacterized protein YggE